MVTRKIFNSIIETTLLSLERRSSYFLQLSICINHFIPSLVFLHAHLLLHSTVWILSNANPTPPKYLHFALVFFILFYTGKTLLGVKLAIKLLYEAVFLIS